VSTSPPPARASRRWSWRPLLAWILPAVIVAVWWGSVSLGIFQAYQLPPPPVVLDATINLWQRGLLQGDIVQSVLRVAEGFVIGSIFAILLGTLTGLWPRAEEALEPTLQALRTVPTLAWAPLLLLWLGIDEPPKIALVAIGAFFPVYVNLVAGIKGVDRKLIEVARVYNLTDVQVARRVVLPASLPSLLTGLRLGATQAWLFVVVAEFFGSSKGLGFRLTDSQQSARVDLMFVALVALAILGKLTDSLIRFVERRVLSWEDTLGQMTTEAAARETDVRQPGVPM
jgi:sulfonate transport system permease protein